MQLTFDTPVLLWFLLAIPALIAAHFVGLAHLHRSAITFANFSALKRVTGKRPLSRNLPILGLRVLAMLCLVLAAAGTTFWFAGSAADSDFIIAIDTSASMTAQDFSPNRLEAAKMAASDFVTIAAGGRIGVVSFSGSAFIDQIPTQSRAQVLTAITDLEIISEGGTDIPGAIITATNLLLASQRGRTVILLTDGASTTGEISSEAITKAAQYAQERVVKVHTIGIGSRSGNIGFLPEYYGINGTYQEDTLTRISNITGGTFYPVPLNDPSRLIEAYREIGRPDQEVDVPHAISPGLMMTALGLLLLEWGLLNTRFRRIP